MGTDCSLTFQLPWCLCILAESHPGTSSIWQVPTHLSWLTSSLSSLGILPRGPASRQNGHSHFCFSHGPLFIHQGQLWKCHVDTACQSLTSSELLKGNSSLSSLSLQYYTCFKNKPRNECLSGIIGAERQTSPTSKFWNSRTLWLARPNNYEDTIFRE